MVQPGREIVFEKEKQKKLDKITNDGPTDEYLKSQKKKEYEIEPKKRNFNAKPPKYNVSRDRGRVRSLPLTPGQSFFSKHDWEKGMVQQDVMSSSQNVSFFGLVSQCVKGKKRHPFYLDNSQPKNQQKINSRVSPHKPIYACTRTRIERVLAHSDKK